VRIYGRDKQGNTLGWGLFGRASIADGGSGNPNFVGWTVSAGIGGDSPWRHDRGDKFGIGYLYSATSTEWGPVSRALFGPRDSQVLELYYKFQLTPWLSVTPDVQYLRGSLGRLTSGDDAFIYGLRVNMKL
jgi:porin